MMDTILRFFELCWAILFESSAWILISLLAVGLIHEFLRTGRVRGILNRPGQSATWGAVGLGAMLPICSCGVIPLAVGLFRSGIRIGPVMAFTAATPIINPAAVILSLALLGTQLTIAYVLLGLLLPFVLGFLSERFFLTSSSPMQPEACCASDNAGESNDTFLQRVLRGLAWGLFDLGPSIGFYLTIGIILSGIIHVAMPPAWMDQYLGGTSFIGLLAAGVLGASIYVCAVAHIPVVATLLAAGAGPGAAIVFLITGTATNLPELFTLYKTIGKRIVLIYTTTLISASMVAGFIVNLWLFPEYRIQFNPLDQMNKLAFSQCFTLDPEILFNTIAAIAVAGLAALGIFNRLKPLFRKQPASDCCPS